VTDIERSLIFAAAERTGLTVSTALRLAGRAWAARVLVEDVAPERGGPDDPLGPGDDDE